MDQVISLFVFAIVFIHLLMIFLLMFFGESPETHTEGNVVEIRHKSIQNRIKKALIDTLLFFTDLWKKITLHQ